jgi:hypothetical protein
MKILGARRNQDSKKKSQIQNDRVLRRRLLGGDSRASFDKTVEKKMSQKNQSFKITKSRVMRVTM